MPAGSAPPGTLAGSNDVGTRGYGGPCPAPGRPHRYVLTLYALDAARLPGAIPAHGSHVHAFLAGHIFGTATLTGTYGRRSFSTLRLRR